MKLILRRAPPSGCARAARRARPSWRAVRRRWYVPPRRQASRSPWHSRSPSRPRSPRGARRRTREIRLRHAAWRALPTAAPSRSRARRRCTPPLSRAARAGGFLPRFSLLGADVELGKELRVARVFRTHIPGELLRRHRWSEIHGQRLEALEHHGLLHHLDHLAVQAIDHLARRAGGRIEAEMRPAV